MPSASTWLPNCAGVGLRRVTPSCQTWYVSLLPVLVNPREHAADRQLRSVCEQRDARVLTKVRVADAIDIDALGLSGRERSYALSAHLVSW